MQESSDVDFYPSDKFWALRRTQRRIFFVFASISSNKILLMTQSHLVLGVFISNKRWNVCIRALFKIKLPYNMHNERVVNQLKNSAWFYANAWFFLDMRLCQGWCVKSLRLAIDFYCTGNSSVLCKILLDGYWLKLIKAIGRRRLTCTIVCKPW